MEKISSLFVHLFIQLVNNLSFFKGFLRCSVTFGYAAWYFGTEARIQIKGEVFLGSICWRIISPADSIGEYSYRFKCFCELKYLPVCWIPRIHLTCYISIPETINKAAEHLRLSIMFCVSSRSLLSDLKNISLLNWTVFLLDRWSSFWVQVSFFLSKSHKDGTQYSWEDHINNLYNNISSSLPLLQRIHFTC